MTQKKMDTYSARVVIHTKQYKTKKAKGEIIGEVWVCKITKILGGVWDDYE